MYQYRRQDKRIVNQRVAQFRDQTERYLNGLISDNEFLPLRLQNGLYIQRHAPMLRIAVPYGMINSTQLRRLADICDEYDRGYLHVTTRQNVQLNWLTLESAPDILQALAEVDMHAIQTSGNCIRNTTTDAFAGVAQDEIVDPRPWCELIRQWSTLHPEFAFLPRKFKIALCGSQEDRAATRFHDIGLKVYLGPDGREKFDFFVGGGLGRTPIVAPKLFSRIDYSELLQYLDAILRIYNLKGRRDNKYKARIKILVKALGVEQFAELVENEVAHCRTDIPPVTPTQIDALKAHFVAPNYPAKDPLNTRPLRSASPDFMHWFRNNTRAHKHPGYRAVSLSLKNDHLPPGDISSSQLRFIADLADRYSFSEARTTHEQNIVLADVPTDSLEELFNELNAQGLANPNIDTLTDMICCPGGDYCGLANAKSIPVAKDISERFNDHEELKRIGPVSLNISGCMNACGHHHIGNIGILGVDKKGEEFFQVSLGGSNSIDHPNIGKIIGPSFASAEIPSVIEKIIDTYSINREVGESFKEAYDRLGHQVFKEAVYAK